MNKLLERIDKSYCSISATVVTNGVTLVDIQSWRSVDPVNELEFRWTPSDFNTDTSKKLDIKLFTYHENSTVS